MQEQIGRYEIRRELGQGGMATVYLAYDPRFQRLVAIKVLPRQFSHDPKYLARFEQEARMIAALEHPAIVPVYDFGEQDDAPYLVMRYMPGGSLRERLQGEPLSLEETLVILRQLAPAVDYAHELGIVHRDLKPENIFFDVDGRPYLADFGIARLAEDTKTLTVVGTRAYMSPEQVEGDVTPDGRVDIYALGTILYELLTGKLPYEAETPTKQMMAHVLKPVPKILEDNPDLPPQTQAIIDKVMAKKRDERYATASELTLAFTALAGSDIAVGSEKKAAMTDAPLVPEPSPAVVAPVLAAEKSDAAEAVLDVPEEIPPKAAPAPETSRNNLVKLLIALAVFAGIFALIDAGRYTGLIELSELPSFGYIWFPAPEWFAGIVSAGIGLMWFAAAYSLWSFNTQALRLVRITAAINLIFMGIALGEDVDFINMMWAMIVNILALIITFLPSVKRAFVRQAPEAAGRSVAANSAASIEVEGSEKPTSQAGSLPWWLVAVEGSLLILIGIYLILMPLYDFREFAWLIGFYWFFSGAMNFVKIFFERSLLGLKIAAGFCGIVVGFLFFQYLKNGYIDVDQIIIVYLGIIIGAANLIEGIKSSSWGTLILGVTSILMAGLLLAAGAGIISDLAPWSEALLPGIGGLLALTASLQMRRQQPIRP